MDSDAYDEGIPDEDFLIAFDQESGSFSEVQAASFPPGNENGSPKAAAAVGSAAAMSAAIELEDLPSDAFSSPEPPTKAVHQLSAQASSFSNAPRTGLSRTNSGSFRQTTLFGGEATMDSIRLSQLQSTGNRVFRADAPREEPTHHEIDKEAMRTWVYPTNLGAIRDYQFSIVKNSLFNNTLIALPTGLGKTFIAATVMLNFHRWTKNAKIVFVAPTKPLVAQQIDACYNIAGIPRSETTLLTGDVQPALRAEEWKARRVFFMTPQTLLNDISQGYADPKSIALLVVDEAHRAVGEYAYAKVTKLIRRFTQSFRVLALTATPGSKIETVQEVIDNLGVSHCEIRTEDSIDIRQYVHQRNIEQVVLDPSYEMNHVCELFTKALQPLVDKLSSQNIYYGRSTMALTAYGLMQAQKEWFAKRGRSANQGVQFMMRAVFSVLTSIAHSIKLLNFHGIRPFYDNLVDMRSEQEGRGEKGSKYKRQLLADQSFQEMMSTIDRWLRTDGFVGHPKLTALADRVLNHFMDSEDTTRVIVFSEYRDSAEDIVRTLNKHRPLVKASIFVGQADGKRGEGMKQAQQIQTIERFRKGEFNVLVATSIGEEGLDIGQVDLIVCYDSSASPIRMLQRMGRTGRKRAGHIVLLLMRGKEEDQFARSKDNYEKMQKLICEGSRFDFRFDLSSRIVPRDIRPEVDKRHVHIPIENTQDTSLPEPTKRRAPKNKKKPAKKFHMPDGVETGFKKLSEYLTIPSKASKPVPTRNPELDDLASVPGISTVVLGDEESQELDRSYRDLPFNKDVVEEAAMPCLTSQPSLQRQLRPTVYLKHGAHTKRCVKLLQKMSGNPENLIRHHEVHDASRYQDIPVKDFLGTDDEVESDDLPPVKEKAAPQKRQRKQPKANLARSEETAPSKRRKVLEGKSSNISSANPYLNQELADEDDKSENEGLTRRIRKPNVGKKRGHQKRGGINSDEIGDDCDRESDMMDTDGSDYGSDLEDFIVSDNHVPSSVQRPSSTLPTSPSQATPRAKVKATEPYYVPTNIPATQDSDDIPDLDELIHTGKGKKQVQKPSSCQSPVPKRAARRRNVVESDSDE